MRNKLIIPVFLLLILSSCIKDVLDRKPLDIISDEDVWESRDLIDIYIASLYDAIPIGFPSSSASFGSYLTDESVYHEDQTVVSNYGSTGYALNAGMYSWIRRANYFLEHIGSSPLSEEDIKTLSAEVRFIRAYYYFDLVKKYGGMPLIKEVQEFDDNLEELKLPRNKEEDIWNFIRTELDTVSSELPDEYDETNQNRATKYVALALKSRAMLYAGSIAKYGSVDLNGLVGVPTDRSSFYYRESLSASEKIIDDGPFSLYQKLYDPDLKTGDPSQNYQSIFTDENNDEIIFQKAYNYPDKAHSYDNFNIPEGFTTNSGSAIDPTLEMVESYEYIDGSKGTLDLDKEYDDPNEIFKDKDPRFDASILHGGSSTGWGRPVEIYRGIYVDGDLYESLQPFPLETSRMQVGRDGPFSDGNYGKTGFYIKKYMNMNERVVEPGHSSQNFIDIRLSEILLNYAEAATEIDSLQPEVLEAINQIRRRAGIAELTSSEINIPKIRNERKVELAFEGKRFWDIRRWRIGTDLFQNTYVKGLWPYLKYENGEYKYLYKEKSGAPIDAGLPRVFRQRDYYSNLSSYISSNPNIEPNPGW